MEGASETVGKAQELAKMLPLKKARYEKQTEALKPFRLLLFEVLHRGEIFKNKEYRKK